MSKRTYARIFIVVYLLVAFFLVWRTEHREVVVSKNRDSAQEAVITSLETRLRQSETTIQNLTVQLTAALSVNYSPSLDLIYTEHQLRFYNRGRSNLYLWGTRLGDGKPLIGKEPRLISPAGNGLIGQAFYYILGDSLEREALEKIGKDGETRVPFEAFVAAEDKKRYRIRYSFWVVVKAGNMTIHTQNTGMSEMDWTKN